jgi:hypothetical protein
MSNRLQQLEKGQMEKTGRHFAENRPHLRTLLACEKLAEKEKMNSSSGREQQCKT